MYTYIISFLPLYVCLPLFDVTIGQLSCGLPLNMHLSDVYPCVISDTTFLAGISQKE